MKTKKQTAEEVSKNIAKQFLISKLNWEIILLLKQGKTQKELVESLKLKLTAKQINNIVRQVYRLLNKNRKPGELEVTNLTGVYIKLKMFTF